jgi:hypothetical protein
MHGLKLQITHSWRQVLGRPRFLLNERLVDEQLDEMNDTATVKANVSTPCPSQLAPTISAQKFLAMCDNKCRSTKSSSFQNHEN